jgi:chromate transport protein ChrA
VLMLIILVLTDNRNLPYQHAIVKHLAPYFIGMTVACIISLFAPFTQAGFNSQSIEFVFLFCSLFLCYLKSENILFVLLFSFFFEKV